MLNIKDYIILINAGAGLSFIISYTINEKIVFAFIGTLYFINTTLLYFSNRLKELEKRI